MKEDKVTNTIIQMERDDAQIFPEVHYNYYGDRGVVDLVIIRETGRKPLLRVIEVKSDSAIDAVTGANEIIRQFNRHKEYFLKGSRFESFRGDIEYELAFPPSERCYTHIVENREIYENALNSPACRLVLYDTKRSIRGLPLLTNAQTGGWAGQQDFSEQFAHIDVPSEEAI